jgi:hypothetical protein
VTTLTARRGGTTVDVKLGNGTALAVNVGVMLPTTVDFTVTGATFHPEVELAAGSSATVQWLGSTGTVLATGVAPTISFGSTGTRTVRMSVSDPTAVRSLNLGFSASDDVGRTGPGSAYNKAAEQVTGVTGLTALTGLTQFMAAHTPLTGTLNLTGLAALVYVECFEANITAVNVTGCSSLVRLCVEACNLTALDVNPVAGNLQDLRAAVQKSGTLTFTPMTSSLPNLWHYCVRDQTVVNLIPHSRLPAVVQCWIWNTNQTTAVAPTSADLNSLLAYDNHYDAASVNTILTGLVAVGSHGGVIDLSGSAAPTGAGATAKTTLQSRGWTVTTA